MKYRANAMKQRVTLSGAQAAALIDDEFKGEEPAQRHHADSDKLNREKHMLKPRRLGAGMQTRIHCRRNARVTSTVLSASFTFTGTRTMKGNLSLLVEQVLHTRTEISSKHFMSTRTPNGAVSWIKDSRDRRTFDGGSTVCVKEADVFVGGMSKK